MKQQRAAPPGASSVADRCNAVFSRSRLSGAHLRKCKQLFFTSLRRCQISIRFYIRNILMKVQYNLYFPSISSQGLKRLKQFPDSCGKNTILPFECIVKAVVLRDLFYHRWKGISHAWPSRSALGIPPLAEVSTRMASKTVITFAYLLRSEVNNS